MNMIDGIDDKIHESDENLKTQTSDSPDKNSEQSKIGTDTEGNLEESLCVVVNSNINDKMAAIDKIKGIIDRSNVALLTTISGKKLVSRPMFVHGKAFDGTLWFITRRDSPKVAEIEKDSRVNVSFRNKSYISLSGRAFIIDSDLKKKAYWGKREDKFFGTNFNDPSVVLIKVEAMSAEIWESAKHRSFIMQSANSFSYNSSATVEF